MTVHIFGSVWRPSCASFAVRRTALDNMKDFPEAAVQTVLENFYLDDCLRSVSSEREAIRWDTLGCRVLFQNKPQREIKYTRGEAL